MNASRAFLVWKYEYQGDSHHAVYARREDAEAHVAEYQRLHPCQYMHIDEFELRTTFDGTKVTEWNWDLPVETKKAGDS